MKIIKRFLYLLCVPVLLTACGHTSDDIGGTPVTPEMLDSLSRSLAQTTAEPTEPIESQSEQTSAQSRTVPPQTDTKIPQTNTTTPPTEITVDTANTTAPSVVYWTEGGSVYHHSSDCSSLRSSENILQGSIEDALLAEKERACKRCS